MNLIQTLRESIRDRRRWYIATLQYALTLAIALNAYGLVAGELSRIREDNGVDIDGLVLLTSKPFWNPGSNENRRHDMVRDDLRRLNSLPEVISAGVISPPPLLGGGRSKTFHWRNEGDQTQEVTGPYYVVSSDTLQTLGLEVVEGRNFSSDDMPVKAVPLDVDEGMGVVIITRDLARALFGEQPALGKVIGPGRHRIIGIVDRFRTPYGGGAMEKRVAFFPGHLGRDPASFLLVRVDEQHFDGAIASLPGRLLAGERDRIVTSKSLGELERMGLRTQHLVVRAMAFVMAMLMFVSGLAVYGLASTHLARRRREIGMRRAMGVPRSSIVGEVLIDSMASSMFGACLGLPLAWSLNFMLATRFALDIAPLALAWCIVGVAWCTGVSVVASVRPALRAGRVAPAIAARAD